MNEDLLKSNLETIAHIEEVRKVLYKFIHLLGERAINHDKSKLESPEQEIFGRNYTKLKITEYGTPEYQKLLEEVKPALDHHYSKNRHHPQYWPNGIDDMTLVDLVEMFSDWNAATQRNKNGNIRKSIEHNATRFNISPQLVKIFENTLREIQ